MEKNWLGSNTSRPVPPADTGSALLNWISDASLKFVHLERRIDPFFRPAFDAVLRDPLTRLATALINWQRPNEGLKIAEERVQPDEEASLQSIIDTFKKQMSGLWKPGAFERGGNTKTQGIVRAEFIVHDGLPPQIRHGIYAQPKTYRAWVRFSGPGPYVTPDIDDVGFMSISIKLMGVPGPKLMGEEKFTQDMFGVSTPAFVTPDTRANAQLQIESLKNASIFYFVNFHRPHLLDLIMQGLWIKTQSSPFEAPYFSCVPYLLGEGQAMQYSVWPKSNKKTPIPRLPLRPPDDYLRNAMVRCRARHPPAVADRSASDADRKQRGHVAGALVAARLGGDAAHSEAEIRFAGADRVRAAAVVQPVALHRRTSAAGQPKPGTAPDVLRVVEVPARDDGGAAL